MTERYKQIINSFKKISGAVLKKDAEEKLGRYFDYLLEYNKKVNLISRMTETEVLINALTETYFFYENLRAKDGRFLDVGTGGGLPGIIIAVLMADSQVDLLDSIKKKTLFLELATKKIGLNNTKIINSRLESLPVTDKYDAVFSRGVGHFENLRRHYLNNVKKGGRLFLLTGKDNTQLFKGKKILKNPFLDNRVIIVLEK
ncbi:MAG: 16S rRNA (guanine(527)-N(7))-methyltransferase RsmG [Candidatus Delongbacteria bacterium]